MKYDFLHGYKQYLYENLKKNTAKTYCSAVNKVLRNLRFNDLSQIPDNLILEEVRKLGNKNLVSAAKNGLKHLKKYDGSLNLPSNDAFTEISKHKRNYVKSKGEKVDFDQMQRKVNAITNKKLKLAFRLASISGLRVSELADLRAEDLKFSEDGNITVSVRNGKGGKSGQVECLEDNYVYEQLKKFCDGKKDDPLFYSESYMREKAGKLGMEMHDFRRAFAVLKKMDCMDNGCTSYEANAEVQEGLRHERFSTTKRYLYGRKIITQHKRKNNVNSRGNDSEEDSEVPDYKSYTKDEYDMASILDYSDLTSEEEDVLYRYSENDFEEINRSLYEKDYPYASDWQEDIGLITGCIDRKRIPDNLNVYRGIRDPSILFGEDADLTAQELNEKYKGNLVLHKNFMSTSTELAVSEEFIKNGGYGRKVMLYIKIPKGRKGIFMGKTSCYPQESEILMQRSSVLEIESVIAHGEDLLVNALVKGQLNIKKGENNER